MQTKQELEEWYGNPDPWHYETTADDVVRKKRILSVLGTHKRALDLGAGEGFITRNLPAKKLFAYEISDNASKRLPEGILRVTEPIGDYDLVIATGVLYEQYDYEAFLKILEYYRDKATILTCNIKDWERGIERLGKPDVEEFFNYREYIEHLCIFNPIKNVVAIT